MIYLNLLDIIYKIHKATLNEDGEIIVTLNEVAYDFYDVDRRKVSIMDII